MSKRLNARRRKAKGAKFNEHRRFVSVVVAHNKATLKADNPISKHMGYRSVSHLLGSKSARFHDAWNTKRPQKS